MSDQLPTKIVLENNKKKIEPDAFSDMPFCENWQANFFLTFCAICPK